VYELLHFATTDGHDLLQEWLDGLRNGRAFAAVLRRVATAFGGVGQVAEAADLNATTLYRTLSRRGNPELKSLTAILKAMGLRIAVQPL